MYYSDKELISRVKQLQDYKSIPEGYWIIGIRNHKDSPDVFDDTFYLMKGQEIIIETTGTTNPGLKVLKGFSRYNKAGAAVVESNRIYHNVWKYGMHRGYMPALKQLGSKITVWRDNNGDSKSDESGKKFDGWFGINFHTATKSYLAKIVKKVIGGWSAGCQVCNVTEDYMKIINTIKNSDQKFVTYCLLKEFSV